MEEKYLEPDNTKVTTIDSGGVLKVPNITKPDDPPGLHPYKDAIMRIPKYRKAKNHRIKTIP